MTAPEAGRVAREIGDVVARWRKVGARHGLTTAQLDRMESAFEHDDLRSARSLT